MWNWGLGLGVTVSGLLACSGNTTTSGGNADAGSGGVAATGGLGAQGGVGGSGGNAGSAGRDGGNADATAGTAGGGGSDGACNIESGFAGDDRCLLAPASPAGFQLHYGPRNYDNPSDVEPFLINPGEEISDCVYLQAPNDQNVYFREHHIRVRPGAHYVSAFTASPLSAVPDGMPTSCSQSTATRPLVAAVGNMGDFAFDVPTPGVGEAPENSGHAFGIEAGSIVGLQVHFVNTSSEPMLREAWFNFHVMPSDQVSVFLDPMEFVAGLGMSVQPNTTQIITAESCEPPSGSGGVRVLSLMSHLHAHTVRASVWKISGSGARELVYETFDWAAPLIAHYDSVHDNPTPDRPTMRDGATSGILTIAPGESLSLECEINNTTDAPLVSGNGLYSHARCDLLGVYGPSTGGVWRCVSL